MQKDLEIEAEFGQGSGKSTGDLDKDSISKRLEEIYKRLEFIDADAAEARAASILAVCFFSFVCTICTISCCWFAFGPSLNLVLDSFKHQYLFKINICL